ncbi:MAG: hypothetical protein ACRDS9_19665, partial [Pseudonocardiaceae bacterium]
MPAASISRRKVVIVGSIVPISIRLMVDADMPERRASSRMESPARALASLTRLDGDVTSVSVNATMSRCNGYARASDAARCRWM